ncbi:MAG: hypothetical protein UR89_C0010G0006 [Candidatus Roizmanbacteria bacterium GW2011_GWA2_35_8]|uniref:Uncharacterized protein n=1 Tax=Candidatus Roizmanbacteria bacterium GW2011_GWA2_35_8 TaxID=1618479 RepID=A0A0G0FHJ3_9BACT|nr:MAG: hypothetical protein UR89_C0010G0006 [Candidatus Roizmanbacteria bacterium GW2011_GWA2_35_8]
MSNEDQRNQSSRQGETYFNRADRPFTEGLPRKLLPYAKSLERAGFERLIPLLDKKTETLVLNGLSQSLTKAIARINPSSQPKPGGRDPDEVKQIRLDLERLMIEYALKHNLDPKIIPTIKVFPPEKLFGLCASDGSSWKLTDFGEAVKDLNARWKDDLSLFLYGGRARETSDLVSRYRKREILPIKTLRIPAIDSIDDIGKCDYDYLGVASLNGPTLEGIERRLQKVGVFQERKGGWVRKKTSTRRNGFSRVELGVHGYIWQDEMGKYRLKKPSSLGHIFYPGLNGNYERENLLIPFLMEDGPTVDIPIRLISHHHKEENQDMLWGLGLDFFNGYEQLSKPRLNRQSWLGQRYSVAFYPFPEITFSSNSLQQQVFEFFYALRTWPWVGQQPIIISSDLPMEHQLDDPINIKRFLSKRTQDFVTSQIIYPLARKMNNDKGELGTQGQRLEFGISAVEDISNALDGDPIATILRILPANQCFTEDPVFKTNTNIHSFGVIDKDGLFPELGSTLNKNPTLVMELVNRLKEFVRLIDAQKEISILEDKKRELDALAITRPYEVEKEGLERLISRIAYFRGIERHILEKEKTLQNVKSGREIFFDFIFEIARKNPSKTLESLRPVWCSEEEWKRVIKNEEYLKRLSEIDSRFSALAPPPPEKRVKIIEGIFRRIKTPMTLLEIADYSGINKNLEKILEILIKKGKIIRSKEKDLCSLYCSQTDSHINTMQFLKERLMRELEAVDLLSLSDEEIAHFYPYINNRMFVPSRSFSRIYSELESDQENNSRLLEIREWFHKRAEESYHRIYG